MDKITKDFPKVKKYIEKKYSIKNIENRQDLLSAIDDEILNLL